VTVRELVPAEHVAVPPHAPNPVVAMRRHASDSPCAMIGATPSQSQRAGLDRDHPATHGGSGIIALAHSTRRSAMNARRGIYIVPTDHWYIERTVWLVAGVVLLASTAAALWLHPLWVLGVGATGVASILVALTGFCIVGNVLARLGFRPALARPGWRPGRTYFMQTDRWFLERRIYLAVGINVILASALSLLHSPWWLAFTGFVGGAMLWFAATGFCIMANALYWMGAEPRLAPGARRSVRPAVA
jgi:hypothetical protein